MTFAKAMSPSGEALEAWRHLTKQGRLEKDKCLGHSLVLLGVSV